MTETNESSSISRRLSIIDSIKAFLSTSRRPGGTEVFPRIAWIIFAVFAVATMMQGTGTFHYDADHYWRATMALVGSDEPPAGYLEMRGVLTLVVFAPAAALTALLGVEFAGFSVLLQNSLALAAVAAFLVPALIRPWRYASTTLRWATAFAVWIVGSGFAPYPLVDTYPVIAIFAAIVLLRTKKWAALLLAGIAFGVAMNLRPAYVVVVALITLATVAWLRWASLLLPAGIAFSLIPQVLLNQVKFGEWSLLPVDSSSLVALQSSYASFAVRYDTILGAESARQFYCSPDMARLVGNAPPETGGALVLAFLDNFPTSFLFALQKIGAALHWPLTTPYAVPNRGLDAVFGVVVAVVTVVGIAAVLYYSTRRFGTEGRRNWYEFTVIAAAVVGVILTLVSAATESRFAVLLVLLGAIGFATLVESSIRSAWGQHRWWVVGTAAVSAVVLILGSTGLEHPAPRGDVNTSICASV